MNCNIPPLESKMKKVLLVGAGAISREYTKILQALNVEFDVFCRRQEAAEQFYSETGILPHFGILEHCCQNNNYSHAIIATTVESLPEVALQLACVGVKDLLLEKPGAVNFDGLAILKQAEELGSNIYIAYNRRFYASLERAKQLIEEDGGVVSCFFDFTEWSHIIEKASKSDFTKEYWFFANSTHVIDMVFHIIGLPNQIECFSFGSLLWHKFPTIYTGAGISEKGVYFSYHANWQAPGRWSVEFNTKNHKLIFKPMERLKVQKQGSIEEISLDIEDGLDSEFKPGFFRQVESFLFDAKKTDMCTLGHLEIEMTIFQKITGVKVNE